ncbi:MAG: HD domain-containing protein [Blautia sp.]|nr:HD domain-containing protein [Lachnoclostridium sp.]MCM1212637.1 HD domain-containing protein [Blautia sp.]
MSLQYDDFIKILNIGIKLTTEKNRNRILAGILQSAMDITNCDASTLYLYEDNQLVFKMMRTLSLGISRGVSGQPITDIPPVPMSEEHVCAYTAIHREIVNIPDVRDSSRFDFSGPMQYDKLTGYHTISQLVIPLENNENELIGVLQLINALDAEGNVIPFTKQYHIIIRSLGSMAAIELSNLAYMEELKAQMYSFVEALTTVLDERTPYNAAHTRNVEKYAGILADYIAGLYEEGKCDEDFDDKRKEQLQLAALLHDIGKMVVPLSIMNRATRLAGDLEKVDTRFELLRSYYEIDMLKGRITKEEYEERLADLEDELAFIHRIDSMGYLDDESYERVCRLAKKQHVGEDGAITKYITEKETEYLTIRKGTLTEADRREMENHVVMTQKILSKVRFHKNFAIVPKWAASHHEFLDGSGYPNHLTAEDLELETRILTIADIYDALTATDRPYKKPVPQEQALEILRDMAKEGKIDAKLVEWFIEAMTKEAKD